MTLAQWRAVYPSYAPMTDHAPCIGIHDVRQIEHTRTYLWDLEDYIVSSVSGGVIWLVPRKAE